MKIDKVTLIGKEVKWASVHSAVPKHKKAVKGVQDKEYKIDIKITSAEAKKLLSMGASDMRKVKVGDESVDISKFVDMNTEGFTTIRKNEKKTDGTLLPKPVVTDKFGNIMSENIGNGSTCNVRIIIIGDGTDDRGLVLDTVLVKELVEYDKGVDLSDMGVVEQSSDEDSDHEAF